MNDWRCNKNHNLQYRIWKGVDFRCVERLMILSSPINDIYFHEWFSQPIVSKTEISSCSDTNFADMSNICFVRTVVFTMELQLFWKLFAMNVADSIVTAINIPQIIECSSPSPVTLEILFCLFRTWSFTRFTNDLESTDNSNSVSSFPRTNCWGLTSSWEEISGRPDLSRSVSPYLTDCAVPSVVFTMDWQLFMWFFPMNNADSNVTNMNILHITECFSFFFCNIHRRSFCLFRTWSFTLSKNDLDPKDKSNSVSSSPMMNCCSLISLWQRVAPFYHEVFPQWQRVACMVLGLLMRETWFGRVCPCPKSDNKCHRSVIHQFINFPPLRRPSFIIIPPWVVCWVRAFNKLSVAVYNGLPGSILLLIVRTPRILTSITFFRRAFWRRRWQSWGSPCNQDSSLALTSLWLFLHLILLAFFFDIISEQLAELKWRMLDKHKRWFHLHVSKISLGYNVGKLVFAVDVLDLDFWVQIASIE